METDSRQRELEARRDFLNEECKAHQPGITSKPKDFAAFHDLVRQREEAVEQCRHLQDERSPAAVRQR